MRITDPGAPGYVFFSLPYHPISLRPKYLPQHSVGLVRIYISRTVGESIHPVLFAAKIFLCFANYTFNSPLVVVYFPQSQMYRTRQYICLIISLFVRSEVYRTVMLQWLVVGYLLRT